MCSNKFKRVKIILTTDKRRHSKTVEYSDHQNCNVLIGTDTLQNILRIWAVFERDSKKQHRV